VLYLAYVEHDLPEDLDGPWRETFRLRAGLRFIDSDQRRSVVYHALKDHLPPGTPLLVVAATEIPKFKGMEPGALAWVRQRAPRHPSLD
jgi:hypothetical protein